jgi:hypothetical protein
MGTTRSSARKNGCFRAKEGVSGTRALHNQHEVRHVTPRKHAALDALW